MSFVLSSSLLYLDFCSSTGIMNFFEMIFAVFVNESCLITLDWA